MRSSLKAGIFLAAFMTAARADLYNHKIVLVGDKGAALGGAFTGLADDATATYYNPAGLTQIKNIKLNVSAQVVQYQKQKIGIAEGTDIPYNSFNFSPTITAFSQRMGNWAYGFSVVTPINDLFTGEQKIEGAYHEPTDINDGCYADSGQADPCYTRLNLSYYDVAKSTMIGPSLALKYNEKISLGFTIYAIYSTELEKTAYGGWDGNYVGGDTDDLSRFHESLVTRSVNQTGLGATGMFGMLVQMNQGFSVGINISPGSMVWMSRVEEQRVEEIRNDSAVKVNTDPNNPDKTQAQIIYNLSGNEKHTEISAPSLSLAVSWKPWEPLMLTAQTDYYLGSQYTYTGFTPEDGAGRSGFEAFSASEITYTIKKNAVANFSGGVELQVMKGYSVAVGGYTDFSQGPDDDRPASWDRNIDYYGFTASLGMDKDLTQSRFGFGLAYGDAAITHFQWVRAEGGQPILKQKSGGGIDRVRQNFDAFNIGIFLSSTLKI